MTYITIKVEFSIGAFENYIVKVKAPCPMGNWINAFRTGNEI